jgi:hypothetical protein
MVSTGIKGKKCHANLYISGFNFILILLAIDDPRTFGIYAFAGITDDG